jgi:hypothetical protein
VRDTREKSAQPGVAALLARSEAVTFLAAQALLLACGKQACVFSSAAPKQAVKADEPGICAEMFGCRLLSLWNDGKGQFEPLDQRNLRKLQGRSQVSSIKSIQ